MRRSLVVRGQIQSAINDDIAERTRIHQGKIAILKSTHAALTAAGAAGPSPLVMPAHGDSRFDDPLSGNSASLRSTDVIAQFGSMGNVTPFIMNVSHHGDATTDELSLPKQPRMIQALGDPANWPGSGRPDAILFSGGGNDIVGDQFCIFLDYATTPGAGLNPSRFSLALGAIEASFLDLFAFRDRYAKGVPIFAHRYDLPIPNGVHPTCAGPWLKPSLECCGYTVPQGTQIVHSALAGFRMMLLKLAADPKNNFSLLDTQGTLAAADWANELQPFPAGFKAIAGKFVGGLHATFPGRI